MSEEYDEMEKLIRQTQEETRRAVALTAAATAFQGMRGLYARDVASSHVVELAREFDLFLRKG